MSLNRNRFRRSWTRSAVSLVPVCAGVILIPLMAGCAAPRAAAPRLPPAADTAEVVAYPLRGQSDRQIRQDRYECYLWAVRQSGYDPAAQSETVESGVRVVPDPPAGAATVTGAVTGAAVGALVSGPRHGGSGAAVGAVVGALAGASVDADHQARADAAQSRYDASAVEAQNRQVKAYKRALSACLDARGYSVR